MKLKGFYFISDSELSALDVVETVGQAVKGGARIVQFRDKDKSTRDLIYYATEMKKTCFGKALFIVNDRVDVALACDADGVHLGQEDMSLGNARKILGEDKIIGVTVHNVQEAMEAEAAGADYLGVSPIFATDTKKDAGEPSGIRLIKEVRENTELPLAAIGGINKDNVKEVISAGSDMVCAISATVCDENVADNVKFFTDLFQP